MLMTQDGLRAALAERDSLKVEVTTLKGELRDARQDLSALRKRRVYESMGRKLPDEASTAPDAEIRHQLAILREENRELRRTLRTAARTGYAPQIP